MKAALDLVIVIPVGPMCKTNFLLDTLSSIKHHIHSRYQIIIADDSQNPSHKREISHHFQDTIVLANHRNLGKGMGLYTSLCNAYRYALDHYDFPALLRLDTDALIIGDDPELPIIDFFKNNPKIGLAGRHVKGSRSVDEFGNVWENGGRKLYVALAKIFTKFFMKHPLINWRVRKILFKALNKDYEIGELVFGGAYAFSRAGLERLRDNGLLPLKNVIGSELEEDHFFTMLIGYVGLGFGDLASGEFPFACAWKGLPAGPEVLYRSNKKIIHSTRFWKDMKEEEIRKYFRDIRESAIVSNFAQKTSGNQE